VLGGERARFPGCYTLDPRVLGSTFLAAVLQFAPDAE